MNNNKCRIILYVALTIIVFLSLLCISACSYKMPEGHIGTKELQIQAEEYDSISEEESNNSFNKHEDCTERSFYRVGENEIMFEQIDNLINGSRTYMSIDELIDAPKTHERYAITFGTARGRIVDSVEGGNKYHSYVSVLDEKKGRAYYIECYSNNNDITEVIKSKFETVYYFRSEYNSNIEDISEKYPIAISVQEARNHDGEVVNVKGKKYSYGWTSIGVGGGNTLLQIDGDCEENGLGVHFSPIDTNEVPRGSLDMLDGTYYVRGLIEVYGSTALIWYRPEDVIICDYETYIFHDMMMEENYSYSYAVELYEENAAKNNTIQ